MTQFTTEKQLQKPLLEWLEQRRRIGRGSESFEEVPWFGRKVDLVTKTLSCRVTAYEFKLNGFSRAVEQAAFNRLAFDRAYIVTASHPTSGNLDLAVEAGIGVIVISGGGISELVSSPLKRATQEVRQRLMANLRGLKSNVQ